MRPGIQSFLSKALISRLFLAIVTATSYLNVDAPDDCCGSNPAAEIFDLIVSGDGIRNKKPATDAYLLPPERRSLSAGYCIVFEASQNGMSSESRQVANDSSSGHFHRILGV